MLVQNDVVVVCLSVLGVLIFSLGLLISLERARTKKIYSGLPADPTALLTKLNRAHGNTAEFAPFIAILIIYLNQVAQPQWVLWVIVGITIARFLVVIGFLTAQTLEKIHPLKAVGAICTYLLGLALVTACCL
jgi:uncharacterized membrane protein YecN with MAPEG domain